MDVWRYVLLMHW